MSRGFSLMELVVVLVIAGILAAFALPRLTDSESRASWYAEQVKAAVRYAQRQAVAQRRSVYVNIQPSQVQLCYTADCSMQLAQLSNGQPYVLPAPSSVSLAPTGTFSFDALGRPSGGQSVMVGATTLTVHAETGYVQ